MILRLLTILFSLSLLLACHNDGEKHTKEVSINHLKSLCVGEHHRIVEDISIRGIVVATDWLGELHKSAIIVDESDGLEFAIDIRNINEILPVNSEVTINCHGLMLARIGGNIKLGAPPTGDFPLDNIDENLFHSYIRIVGFNRQIEPTVKCIDELCAEDICTLLQIDNIRICNEEQGLTWCDMEEGEAITTVRTFVDSEGNTLAVQTLSTCHYADEVIPTNEISVVGVIDYSDNRPFLKIINRTITLL